MHTHLPVLEYGCVQQMTARMEQNVRPAAAWFSSPADLPYARRAQRPLMLLHSRRALQIFQIVANSLVRWSWTCCSCIYSATEKPSRSRRPQDCWPQISANVKNPLKILPMTESISVVNTPSKGAFGILRDEYCLVTINKQKNAWRIGSA